MPTRLTTPDAYRPWPSDRELDRQSPSGDWRVVPDDYTPFLADTGHFEDDTRQERERRRSINTWKRSGIDPVTLPALAPPPDSSDDNADEHTDPADQNADDLADGDEDLIAGPVGDDELVFADVDTDEDGNLFYRYVSTEPDGTHTALTARGDHITDDDGYDIIVDADGYPEALGREGDLLGIDADGKVYYLHKIPHKGKDVATNRDGQVLLSAGKPIELDDDNYPVPVKPSLFSKIVHGARERDEVTEDEVLYNKDGVPVRDYSVVGPGKSLTRIGDGPLKSRHRILAAVTAGALVAGGVIWYAGVNVGSSRVPAEGAISADEVEEYGLSSYDRSGAEGFGTTYLQICLTNTGDSQQAARTDYLKSVQSSTANADCGIGSGDGDGDDEGSTESRQPASIRPNGQFEERPAESHGNGGIAMVGFDVAMADGSFQSYTVPIWAGTADGIPSYRVVGNIGKTPASKSEPVDDTDSGFQYDRKLAGELQAPLSTFFKAWAGSSEDELAAATTSDATGMAKEGMHGDVQNPNVTGANVMPARGPDDSDGNSSSWNYTEGDVVTAFVSVDWEVTTSAEPVKESNGYRVTMVYSGSKWEVQDIVGGVITEGEGGSDEASSGEDEPGSLGSVDDLDSGSSSE